MDQTIEQTINRESKTRGGQFEFSNNANTVHRWILSFNQLAEISRSCTKMARKTEGRHKKKEFVSPDMSRMKQTFKMSCIQLSCCKIHLHIIKKTYKHSI